MHEKYGILAGFNEEHKTPEQREQEERARVIQRVLKDNIEGNNG
jgi:hypothetical protein